MFCNFVEFTSMCKTRSEEESHEEHIPFINQDVQKNGISRKKGKFRNETQPCKSRLFKLATK